MIRKPGNEYGQERMSRRRPSAAHTLLVWNVIRKSGNEFGMETGIEPACVCEALDHNDSSVKYMEEVWNLTLAECQPSYEYI